MSSKLRTFLPTVIRSRKAHTATVIFHHGFGATADDWASLAQLPNSVGEYTKFILPQAPLRAITVNRGQPAPAWFDMIEGDHSKRTRDGTEDEVGMNEALDDLNELIQTEVADGIDPSRIVVGGFSQGAAIALLQGLTRPQKLAGIAVMSGYLPLQWKIIDSLNDQAKALPTFWGHGKADSVIKFGIGQRAAERLREAGLTALDFHAYQGMDHGSCEEELHDLSAWLRRVLPPLPANSSSPDQSWSRTGERVIPTRRES